MSRAHSAIIFAFITATILCINCQKNQETQATYQLWYKQPATEWTDALPVGNGRIGAMVFGKVDSERIQLNEESLWAGQIGRASCRESVYCEV